ncbi:hypothetical protein N9L76_01635 [bacterium]|nr:hypothetical protein [bacterium]
MRRRQWGDDRQREDEAPRFLGPPKTLADFLSTIALIGSAVASLLRSNGALLGRCASDSPGVLTFNTLAPWSSVDPKGSASVGTRKRTSDCVVTKPA